jgi:SAM-dependent methyltransferase
MEKDTFKNRVHDYMYAIEKYPYTLHEEYINIIHELEVKEEDIFVNMDGVATPLQSYIFKKNVQYHLIESNIHFFTDIPLLIRKDATFFQYAYIPFQYNYVDKMIIHATLHHISKEDRKKLYQESYRVLKSSGLFLISDVQKESKEARWLNEVVHRYNPNGHCGDFLDLSEISVLEECGFRVLPKVKSYKWWFRNRFEMIDFFVHLFYMKKIHSEKELYQIIQKELGISYDEKEHMYFIEWSLLYLICQKKTHLKLDPKFS